MKKLVLVTLALIMIRIGLEYENILIFVDNSYETKEEKERLETIKIEHKKIDEENKKIIFESWEKAKNKERKQENNVNIESNIIYTPNKNFLEDNKAYEQCLSDDGNYCEE